MASSIDPLIVPHISVLSYTYSRRYHVVSKIGTEDEEESCTCLATTHTLHRQEDKGYEIKKKI